MYFKIKVLYIENKQLYIKGLYVIKPEKDNDTFRIGRNPKYPLNFKGVSISRKHAVLQYYKQKLFIWDEKSKYGILKKLNKAVTLNYL